MKRTRRRRDGTGVSGRMVVCPCKNPAAESEREGCGGGRRGGNYAMRRKRQKI